MADAGKELDKERFEQLKETERKSGRGEAKATEVAAQQVKELRRREGRSKDDDDAWEEQEDV